MGGRGRPRGLVSSRCAAQRPQLLRTLPPKRRADGLVASVPTKCRAILAAVDHQAAASAELELGHSPQRAHTQAALRSELHAARLLCCKACRTTASMDSSAWETWTSPRATSRTHHATRVRISLLRHHHRASSPLPLQPAVLPPSRGMPFCAPSSPAPGVPRSSTPRCDSRSTPQTP